MAEADLAAMEKKMLFNHVMVGTNDLERSRRFYDAVLGALGYPKSAAEGPLLSYRSGEQGFAVRAPRNGEPASCANGGTIGFRAKGTEEVDAFHAAGLAHGGSDDGAPGVREGSPGQPYIAYLRDPDGNKICAMWKSGWKS
ncbi:MAG TPA: VOC family protein [Sphingomonadaceae bacterium]|nr:VOC family protein [Sphingomonadaceae bacterium]